MVSVNVIILVIFCFHRVTALGLQVCTVVRLLMKTFNWNILDLECYQWLDFKLHLLSIYFFNSPAKWPFLTARRSGRYSFAPIFLFYFCQHFLFLNCAKISESTKFWILNIFSIIFISKKLFVSKGAEGAIFQMFPVIPQELSDQRPYNIKET